VTAVAECGAGGGARLGAIWAGGDDCTQASNGKYQLDVSGANQSVTGGVRANGDVNIGTAGNRWTDDPDPADPNPAPPTDPFEFVGEMWPSTSPSGNTFDAGYPKDIGSPTPPSVPPPHWPAGWEPAVADPAAANDAFWAAWRDRAIADGHGGLVDSKVTSLTTSGVYYTEHPDGMDISAVGTANLNVTLVARFGPIKISVSDRSFAPASPADDVLLLSGKTYGPVERCDKYTVAISGQRTRYDGAIWAPGGLMEFSGSDTVVVRGAIVAWAVRLNGSDVAIQGDPSLTDSTPVVRLLE
jgi:hypothetical protein